MKYKNIIIMKYGYHANVDFSVNLCNYEVGIGNSKGKSLKEYFCGRLDKACA